MYEWLTKTILGIIFLGACGSILALILKWLVVKLVKKVLGPRLTQLVTKYLARLRYGGGYLHGWLHGYGDVHTFVLYVGFTILRFLLAVTVAAVCIILLVTSYYIRGAVVLTLDTFLLVVLFFLCLFSAFKTWTPLAAGFRTCVRPILDRAAGKISEEEFDEFLAVHYPESKKPAEKRIDGER